MDLRDVQRIAEDAAHELGLSQEDLHNLLFKRWERVCYLCRRAPGITKDHVVPRSRGGGRGSNLRPACKSCNNRKGSLSLEEFLTIS